MANRIGLYYPYIEFKNDAWLKFAALYWDSVARIVPEGYTPRDSETVRRLRESQLSFVWDMTPGPEPQTIGTQFVAFLEAHRDRLQQRYGLDRMDDWQVDARGRQPENAKLAYINDAKIWDQFAGRLVELRLASVVDGTWIGMHPQLADVYMSRLAEEMAARGHLSPIADETRPHLAAAGWTIERMAAVLLDDTDLASGKTADEVEARLANVALSAVIPADLENIPVERIIELRNRYHDEFVEFHQGMEEIATGEAWLQEVTSDQALTRQLNTVYTNRIKPLQDAYRASLGFGAHDARQALISVIHKLPDHVPEITGLLATAGLGVVSPAVAPVAMVLTLVVAAMLRRSDNEHAQDPQAARLGAYLLEAQTELEPASFRNRVARTVEGITAGAIAEVGKA